MAVYPKMAGPGALGGNAQAADAVKNGPRGGDAQEP
jgi:hypothetical protein